jgi:putative Mn2+ efflux pump MntP
MALMTVLEIILIALGLSMDAFAVSISLGLSVKKAGLKEMAAAGLYFGLFQALMPTAGYFLGVGFADKITSVDHWIAFALLGLIGGKMIKDSFTVVKEAEAAGKEQAFRFQSMLPLAVATSIDALAVGVTFAFLGVSVVSSVSLIGAITFCVSFCGVKIGGLFGLRFKSKAEFAGGAVLVLLGIKILVEHAFFAG